MDARRKQLVVVAVAAATDSAAKAAVAAALGIMVAASVVEVATLNENEDLRRRRPIILQRRRRHRRRQLRIPYEPFVWEMDHFSDDWVKYHCRFSKEEFVQIIPYLALHKIEWSKRYQPSPELAFAIFTCRMAVPQRVGEIAQKFGRSHGYISSVCTDIALYLWERFGDFLVWDQDRLTVDKLWFYARRIERKGGGDLIWGYIDGTFLKTCRPQADEFNQRVVYSGHKKGHGFKCQGITTPDGLISHVFGPIVGSRGDWFIYQASGLDGRMRHLFDGRPEEERLYVFGDAAYTGSYATLGAYRRAQGRDLTEEQRLFNLEMSRLRVSVEHAFGRVQNLWQSLAFYVTRRMGSTPVASYFFAAVLLTNIMTCLRGHQTAKKFDCQPPALVEYFATVMARDDARREAMRARFFQREESVEEVYL